MYAQLFSHVQLFETSWTVAHQAPLSMGLPRQEYWCGLPFLSLEDLPDPGTKPKFLASPALREYSLPLCHLGSILQREVLYFYGHVYFCAFISFFFFFFNAQRI